MSLFPSLPWLQRVGVLGGLIVGVTGCDSTESGSGLVGVGRLWAYSSPTTTTVTASYREFVDYDPACPLPERLNQQCQFRNCLFAPNEQPPPQEAGRITLSGGVEEVELERLDDGRYRAERDFALWTGGEKLTFAVEGDGEIEAAEATLAAPPRLDILAPDFAESEEPIALDRAEPLEVSWQSIPEGSVMVFVGVTQHFPERGEQRDLGVSCWFDGFSSSGKIPGGKDGLAALPQVLELSDTVDARIWVSTDVSGGKTTGKWRQEFGVSSYQEAKVTLQ